MSAKLLSAPDHGKVKAYHLHMGQLAVIDDPLVKVYNGQIVMRTVRGLVSLSSAECWGDECGLLVFTLPKGTVVEVTSEV